MLPRYITYDLQGYRGYNVVKFHLEVFEKDGKWCASYSHDGAGCALATEWADTKEAALNKLSEAMQQYNNDTSIQS